MEARTRIQEEYRPFGMALCLLVAGVGMVSSHIPFTFCAFATLKGQNFGQFNASSASTTSSAGAESLH